MKFEIKHEIPGRIRIHVIQGRMSVTQADTLLYYLKSLGSVTQATVYERTADACVCFSGDRASVIQALRRFRYESVEVPEAVLANSGRALNNEYKDREPDRMALCTQAVFTLSAACGMDHLEIAALSESRSIQSRTQKTRGSCIGCDSDWRVHPARRYNDSRFGDVPARYR